MFGLVTWFKERYNKPVTTSVTPEVTHKFNNSEMSHAAVVRKVSELKVGLSDLEELVKDVLKMNDTATGRTTDDQ